MSDINISEIGQNFYLVRTQENDLHRNIYFKRFIKDGQSVNMIFDPGTKLDGNLVIESSKKLFGGMHKIDVIFLSHQDPDVSSLTPFIIASAKNSTLITSIDTFRLVSMYGIPKSRVFCVENYNTEILSIKKTGHNIQFIPATYCHFRGAIMLYDYESRILVSGDFAAGVNTRKGNGLFATPESWEGINYFHTIYMPSSLALKETVNRIGLLNPLPEIIAPQHGDLINKDLMVDFLSQLGDLEVGIDHLKKIEPQKDILMSSITDFLKKLNDSYPQEWEKLTKSLTEPGQFTSVFKMDLDTITDIKIDHLDAVRYLIGLIERHSEPVLKDEIKTMLNFEFENQNLLLPPAISSKLELKGDLVINGFFE